MSVNRMIFDAVLRGDVLFDGGVWGGIGSLDGVSLDCAGPSWMVVGIF